MKVVCDTGPLISLAKLNQLGLLIELYEEILIPSEVYDEAVTEGIKLGTPDAYEIKILVDKKYISVKKVMHHILSEKEYSRIDIGEAKVISLAINERADIVLIDELTARMIARKKSLKIKGTLGLLIDSYRKGLITVRQLEFLIETIKIHPDLWISKELCDRVLESIKTV